MTRRRVLTLVLAAVGGALNLGHTPYRQWAVYRQRHLLILTSRADRRSYALGKRVAERLATHLPSSKARVTRAPHTERIASLISTKQLDIAVLSRHDAAALLKGHPPYGDYGPMPLRAIIGLGAYLLVCRDDFSARHAYLIAKTLHLHRAELSLPISPEALATHQPDPSVPTHPGSLAYFKGSPLPRQETKAP